ncbi:MAG: ammonium transporter, Amt family, partial [Verrucomicrobiota bacterium]
AVGGTLGAFLTGLLATAHVNPNFTKLAGHALWPEQLKAIAITIGFAVIGSAIIGVIVRGTIGLRIAPEVERQGLDINEHGEEGYMTSG